MRGEIRQLPQLFFREIAHQTRILREQLSRPVRIRPRAGRDKCVFLRQRFLPACRSQQFGDIRPAIEHREAIRGNCVGTFLGRIGALVQKHPEDFDRLPAADRMSQRMRIVLAQALGMRQQKLEALLIGAVERMGHGVRALHARSGIEQQPRARQVRALDRMVKRLVVVGIGAAPEKQSRHSRDDDSSRPRHKSRSVATPDSADSTI